MFSFNDVIMGVDDKSHPIENYVWSYLYTLPPATNLIHVLASLNTYYLLIRSSENDSTGFWPPGSLHTLGADGHI